MALGLVGCQSRTSNGSHLVVASKNRIDTVDPAGAYTFGAMQLLSAIGDPLYAISARGKIEPRLAVAMPQVSADGLTVRVPLRQGVRFHDGTAFNAEAMVFTLQRFLAIGKLSYLLGDRVQSVRAAGPYSLELRLKRPFSPIAPLLSAVNLTPLSPTAYRQYRRRFLNDRFVGTGPYRLSFFRDQQQRLEPFTGYWGRKPANGGIDLVALSNSTALFGALTSGEVDVLLSTSLEIDQQAALHRSALRGQLKEVYDTTGSEYLKSAAALGLGLLDPPKQSTKPSGPPLTTEEQMLPLVADGARGVDVHALVVAVRREDEVAVARAVTAEHGQKRAAVDVRGCDAAGGFEEREEKVRRGAMALGRILREAEETPARLEPTAEVADPGPDRPHVLGTDGDAELECLVHRRTP